MPGGRPRGGSRTGKVGKAYPNRSDLNGGKMPVTAPQGGQYGSGQASMDAQRAVPMGTPQIAGGGGEAGGGGQAAFTGPPPGMPAPGSLGDLFADSQNPAEHVMNGAAMGPGVGPAQLGIDPDAKLRQEDLAALAVWVPMVQEMVNRTGGSPQTRQFLRAILSAGGPT
jgi:hypothetical protein